MDIDSNSQIYTFALLQNKTIPLFINATFTRASCDFTLLSYLWSHQSLVAWQLIRARPRQHAK